MLRRSLIIGLSVLLGASALLTSGGAAASSNLIAPSRHAAVVRAEHLLATVMLPPGSTPVSKRPSSRNSQLSNPILIPMFAAEVDRHSFWTTSASPDAVVASFQSHLPAGAKLVSSFFGRGPGPGSPSTFAGAGYALGTSRRFDTGPEQLMVDAVILTNGLTGVRADSEVRYASPRPRAERVPATAGLVQITKVSFTKRLLSLAVTSPALVRKLAHIVDGLPFANTSYDVAYSCPVFPDVTDRFIFRADADGPVLADVTESAYTPTTPDPCAEGTLTIRGRTLAPLQDGGILLERAGKLLSVKLTG